MVKLKEKLNIAAVGDVHSPKFLREFKAALSRMKVKPDLFLMSGDMIYKGKVQYFKTVVNEIILQIGEVKIVSCFGNEEFENIRGTLRKLFPQITFLDDEYVVLSINDFKLGIVGTQGSLLKPTRWQARNIPRIAAIYRERISKVKNLLLEAKRRSDYVILLMHYAPSFKVMEGEKRSVYHWLGHPGYERVILETRPNLVVYAHLHNANILEYRLDNVRLLNSSLPARGEILTVEVKAEKYGLLKFM